MNAPTSLRTAFVIGLITAGAAYLHDPLPVAASGNSKSSPTDEAMNAREAANYGAAIRRTIAMVSDGEARRLAAQYGLQILNVTWEDTGRYKGSTVGPNISDMTIQVEHKDPQRDDYGLHLMPVIRHPNFSDKTADLRLDRFHILVGNQNGRELKRVNLKEFLSNIRRYLHDGSSWKGQRESLLAERDSHVLVSAQACFLPVPKQGRAVFNPVLFNYQSYEGDPAVLTILATREGTSVTVIDNKRDGFAAGPTWGQRLFFNKDGERAALTAERLSDFKTNGGNSDAASVEVAGEEGLNMVLLIQVPLKQKNPMRFKAGGGYGTMEADGVPMMAMSADRAMQSDVEAAVIGHGPVEGPFTEIDGLEIERDPNFPVRVTVQFYKATSNGIVSAEDVADINKQLSKVYADGDYVGSLVVGDETDRPTEYDGSKVQPPDWWDQFWKRHEKNTGQSRAEALDMLRKLYGPNWMPRNEQALRDELKMLQ